MNRLLLAALAGTLALAGSWAAARRLPALLPAATLVPPDDPTVVLDREVTEEFGFQNPVVWVFEARAGTVWTQPMLERLTALTEEVRTIPGVIAPDIIGLASPNMRDLRVTEDGLEPTYLMGEVPATPEAVTALRRRIDGDPNYAGTLVTRDGRAAMIVANFRDDVDARAVGTAALALRDRHRDADATVWVTGTSVLLAAAPAAVMGLAPQAAGFALAGLVVFGAVLGLRTAASALLAAALAAIALVAGAALCGATLPWSLEAIVPTALAAAVLGTGAAPAGIAIVALGAGGLAGVLPSVPPVRWLWVSLAAGAPVAAVAGTLARGIVAPRSRAVPRRSLLRALAIVVAVAAVLGVSRVGCSFGLLGYGERYLPSAAAEDLVAVRRLFPPPLSLAVRARGEPGFVGAPDVLHALDTQAEAARADPAVRSAMSIADVVKMVNKAFNDERSEFFAIPDDRALAGRFLALAYSPGLRRFLDRSFGDTAVWVQLDGERAADVERVFDRMRAALAARPVPGATVDLPAGDGAVLLVAARQARRLAGAAVLALLVAGGIIAAGGGWRAGVRAVGCGLLAAGVGCGILGWAGQALDLLSIPLLAATAVATTAVGGLAPVGLALGLAGAGAGALAAPLPAAALIAALLIGPSLAMIACASAPSRT